jgi:hypothetical protein
MVILYSFQREFYFPAILSGEPRREKETKAMAEDGNAPGGKLIIMYWRDIPAQVLAKAGRANARRELTPRFQDAIDRAAMKHGARDSDAYLDGWRKGSGEPCGGDLEAVVEEAAARLEQDYDAARLKRLIASGGKEEETGK